MIHFHTYARGDSYELPLFLYQMKNPADLSAGKPF
ncbi:hypothetical protein GGC63_003854 [Paenibacillus sp. OAS669]|nr:hypothetical protein [Paenibacillus sp. OAS669]